MQKKKDFIAGLETLLYHHQKKKIKKEKQPNSFKLSRARPAFGLLLLPPCGPQALPLPSVGQDGPGLALTHLPEGKVLALPDCKAPNSWEPGEASLSAARQWAPSAGQAYSSLAGEFGPQSRWITTVTFWVLFVDFLTWRLCLFDQMNLGCDLQRTK